jgi:hypothetical protein
VSLDVGAVVNWTAADGSVRHGTITRVDDAGRIYVATEQTNHRGMRRTRVVEVWFDRAVGRAVKRALGLERAAVLPGVA